MENVNYLVITNHMHNTSMLSLDLKLKCKLTFICCAFGWLL